MAHIFELDLFGMRKDYSRGVLNEHNLVENPFEQFKIWFNEASENNEFEPNTMALATSGNDKVVTLRMVLLKQINSEGFVFFTNYESTKGVQIAQNNNVGLLFFWPGAMRQVRIEGKAKKISSQESDTYFNSRPIESRASAILSKQSRTLANKDKFDELIEELSNSENILERPQNWGGYVVVPNRFEFWQGGKGRSHDRFEFYLEENQWQIRRLYP